MVSELMRHSDRPDVCELVPEHLRLCHRPQSVTRDDAPVEAHSKARPTVRPIVNDLFGIDNGWALGPLNPVLVEELEGGFEEGDLLELAGF